MGFGTTNDHAATGGNGTGGSGTGNGKVTDYTPL